METDKIESRPWIRPLLDQLDILWHQKKSYLEKQNGVILYVDPTHLEENKELLKSKLWNWHLITKTETLLMGWDSTKYVRMYKTIG